MSKFQTLEGLYKLQHTTRLYFWCNYWYPFPLQGRKKILPTVSCLTDIYQCDKVWISLRHHHYHHCICKKWYCNFHDYVDIIPPSDSSSRWTKNVWQAEKCSIRSRKEKKRHNPISKQSTVTRSNFEIKTHFFCTDFASN